MEGSSCMGTRSTESAHRPPAAFSGQLAAIHEGCDLTLGEMLESCRVYLLWVANKEVPGDVRQKFAPSDVVQETFMEAKVGIDRFRGRSPEQFRGWLRGILLNNVADVARRYRDTHKRQLTRELPIEALEQMNGQLDFPVDDETPSQAMCRSEDVEHVASLLSTLTDSHRQVIQLRNFEGLTFVEIGERMARSPDAVRKLWSRAVEILAAAVQASSLAMD